MHRGHMWRRGRARFVRRVGVIFAVLLFLSVIGLATLVSIAVRGRTPDSVSIDIGPIAALVAIFTVVFFSIIRRVGRPLGDIVEAANRVATGDFSARVGGHGSRPLRMVGTAFNTMAERLEAQDRQRRHLMSDIAHELRTPLSVIQGRLEGLHDGVYARDDATIAELIDETRMLARLVDDLQTLANAESGMLTLRKEPADLAVLAHDVIASFRADANTRHVALNLDTPADLPMMSIDPVRIREVLSNLVSNALHHTPADGRVSIVIRAEPTRLVVTVADTGSGIRADDLPKIFDRFYKGTGSRGSGLGLTIARNLVTAHGGEIHAQSRPGEGTSITFTLPL